MGFLLGRGGHKNLYLDVTTHCGNVVGILYIFIHLAFYYFELSLLCKYFSHSYVRLLKKDIALLSSPNPIVLFGLLRYHCLLVKLKNIFIPS